MLLFLFSTLRMHRRLHAHACSCLGWREHKASLYQIKTNMWGSVHDKQPSNWTVCYGDLGICETAETPARIKLTCLQRGTGSPRAHSRACSRQWRHNPDSQKFDLTTKLRRKTLWRGVCLNWGSRSERVFVLAGNIYLTTHTHTHTLHTLSIQLKDTVAELADRRQVLPFTLTLKVLCLFNY